MKSQNFIVSVIMSDGEGAIGKLIPYLEKLSIEVNLSGAGGHIARIERRIRMIKERIRSHICGRLPFALTINGLSMLALYCISRISYQHSGTRPGGVTPREAFSGQRVAGNRDLRVVFGDYCQCTVANTDRSMSPRTDDCIVYLPTGNRTGSVKKLSIATNKIILRDNFKVLPMPASVILQLKALAAKDGRFLSRIPNVYDEIQYMHSVNKSQVLRFMPIAPPNAEQRIRAASREVPVSIEMHQLVLADTPPVEIVEDIIPSEIGGVTTVSENILELRPEGSDRTSPTVMHDAEQGISQHSTDISTDSVSPDSVLEQHLSLSFPTPTTVNTTTDEHVERNSQEQVIDYFRTGNGILKRPSEQGATFVTFNTPVVTSPTQRVSCTESITAVLTKRKSELHVEPSVVSLRPWRERESGRRRAKGERLWNDAKG